MGNKTEDHIFSVPDKRRALITIEGDFDFSTAIKTGYKTLSDFFSPDDTVMITNLNYAALSDLQLHNSLKLLNNNEFLSIKILDKLSEPYTESHILELKNIGLFITVQNNKLKKENNFYVIDNIPVIKNSILKTLLESNNEIISNLWLVEKMKELGHEEVYSLLDGICLAKDIIVPDKIEKYDYVDDSTIEDNIELPYIEPNTDLIVKTVNPSETSKLIDPVIYNTKKKISKKVITTPKKEIYDILFAFNHSMSKNAQTSGEEHTWKQCLNLLTRSNKFNITISGVYPFDRSKLRNARINFLDESKKELSPNYDLVVTRNADVAQKMLSYGNKLLFFGNESQVELVRTISSLDKVKSRLFSNPNPKVDPVFVFNEIRDILGITKK
jgi:hypothetical protein